MSKQPRGNAGDERGRRAARADVRDERAGRAPRGDVRDEPAGRAARGDVRDEAARAAADFGAAADVVDEAAAAAFGVNRTDLRILGLVHAAGTLSATALSAAAKLSPAATTTAIHRLRAAAYLTRTVDDGDRRRAVVALTPRAEKLIVRVYGPVERAGHRVLADYSDAEVALISGFLRRGIEMQLAEADRIRAMRDNPMPG